MRKTDKKDHIGFELRLIQNLIEARIKAEREEDGLCVTQIQHWIIRYLDKNRGRDIFQKDLEGEFHASKATISSTLQVMERNGLLVRTAVGWDARLKKICLTEKALEFSRRSKENMLRMEALLRKGMSPEESAELMRLLRQVRYNLEQSRSPGQDPGSERSGSPGQSESLDRSGSPGQSESPGQDLSPEGGGSPGQSVSPGQDASLRRDESPVQSVSPDRSGNLQQKEIQEGEQ